MDGHFVPNLTLGPLVVEAIGRVSDLPLDVHLMIEQPDRYIERFARAGAGMISVHQEAVPHLHRTVQLIHECGAAAGVALNPATPLGTLAEILPELDFVLLMSVNPGFGGQRFIPSVRGKIAALRGMIDAAGADRGGRRGRTRKHRGSAGAGGGDLRRGLGRVRRNRSGSARARARRAPRAAEAAAVTPVGRE